MQSSTRNRDSRHGMTLIEIMIVVVIIAAASTGLSYGFGALNRSKLKSACVHILSAARYAYGRSVTRGRTVRIVLDGDANTMSVEDAAGYVTLLGGKHGKKGGDETANDKGAVDPWSAARARLATTMAPTEISSPFGPILGKDEETVLKQYAPRSLGSGVTIKKMILSHRIDGETSSKDAIYFFPGGINDRAVIQLEQGGTVFSVEIFPLSGTGKVYNYAYEPKELQDDDGSLEDQG